MRLEPLVRDYPAFLEELIRVLQAPTTRIYLDTSQLMWLIRVGEAARYEFHRWVGSRPGGTVRVPVWAAHELHRHLAENRIAVNVRKTLGDVASKYDEFAALAAERADDHCARRAGFADHADYLAALRSSQSQFARISNAVAVDDQRLRDVTEAVIDFANGHMMESDLAAVVATLSRVGQFRYDHRMPPGFHDQKDENRFGDAIIWEEIVADMAAATRTNAGAARRRPSASDAVLLSRDKKTDWVTAAPWISGAGDEPTKPNRDLDMDVTLPHPMLLHEFKKRTGAAKIYVVHPAFLATTLDFAARRSGVPSPVRNWLAATHKPRFAEQLEDTQKRFARPSVAPAPPVEPRPEPVEPLAPAQGEGGDWAGLTARDVAAPSVSAEFQAISGALPADIPDVLASYLEQHTKGRMSAVQLGRLFGELSIAGLASWPAELPLHIEDLVATSAEGAQLALLAFLATAYFDRFGEARARPKADLIRAALALEADPRFMDAFRSLGRLLRDAGAKVPYVPGSRQDVRYSLDLGGPPPPLRIRDIRVGSQSALLDRLPSADPRTLSALLGQPPAVGCTGEELRALVAREFLVPLDRLLGTWDRRKLTWSEGAGLAPLDLFGEGGLGAGSDDGKDT